MSNVRMRTTSMLPRHFEGEKWPLMDMNFGLNTLFLDKSEREGRERMREKIEKEREEGEKREKRRQTCARII